MCLFKQSLPVIVRLILQPVYEDLMVSLEIVVNFFFFIIWISVLLSSFLLMWLPSECVLLHIYACVCTEMLERSFLMISLTSSRYIWSSSWGSCLTVMAMEGGLASSGNRLGELAAAWA